MAGANPQRSSEKANGEEAADEEVVTFQEDLESDEGAVWPMRYGRVQNWSCFLALLTHIHNTLSPTLHTPILLITEPAWTSQDREIVTQFCFERFKTPAFCLMDSALAVCYAYGTALATVVDVGYEKCDVTAVIEYVTRDVGRAVAVEQCGGETMTQRLLELLGPQGWTRDMCEQLKRSQICEILPKDEPLPGPEIPPAATAAAGQAVAGSGQRGSISIVTSDADVDGERTAGLGKPAESGEGVLDVATIVASGKTAEFLARKEKEKAEKAARKAGAADAAAAGSAKPTKIPNSKRPKNTFVYTARRQELEPDAAAAASSWSPVHVTERKAAEAGGGAGDAAQEQKTDGLAGGNRGAGGPEAEPATTSPTTGPSDATRKQQDKAARKEERKRVSEGLQGRSGVVRREVEVGVERFRAADGGVLDTIADAVHRTIMSVEGSTKRAELWASLIVVGNGSKIRGRAILTVLLFSVFVGNISIGRVPPPLSISSIEAGG